MTISIQRFDDPPSATGLAIAAACAAIALGFTVGYDPRYGAAAIAICAGVGLIVFAPRAAFIVMLFFATGWPYYVGIPVGRDLPIPFILPMIGATFISVVVRQLLGALPPQPYDPRMRLVDLGVAALTATIMISIFMNDNLEYPFKAFFRVCFMPLLLYLCCRYFVRDAGTTRAGFNALLAGSCVGSLYAVYEWFSGYNPLLETFAPPVGDLAQHGYWTATLANYQGLYRSHGFGMNPIFFGATSSMMLVYAAARVASAESARVRLVFLTLGLICGSGLIVTFSRGPILACAVGIFLLAVAYKPLRIYVFAAALAASLFVLYHQLSENDILKERLEDTDNVTLRLKLWQTAFAMFTDHPVFGVGLDSFPDNQLETIRSHSIGPFFEMGDGRLETVKTAEEAFLQFLAETGLVGAAGAALLIASVAWIYVPALFRSYEEPSRMLIVTAGTCFVVFLGIGLTVTVYNSWETGVVVPFLLAALINVKSLHPLETKRDLELPPGIVGSMSNEHT